MTLATQPPDEVVDRRVKPACFRDDGKFAIEE
jgi:hypothetical protein